MLGVDPRTIRRDVGQKAPENGAKRLTKRIAGEKDPEPLIEAPCETYETIVIELSGMTKTFGKFRALAARERVSPFCSAESCGTELGPAIERFRKLSGTGRLCPASRDRASSGLPFPRRRAFYRLKSVRYG